MFILRHGNARRERPADAGAGHLFGGDTLGAFNKLRIARRAHADVVRKNHRAIYVVMAVNRINAVN